MGNRQTTWRTLLDSLLYGESEDFDRMLTARALTPYLVTASAQLISGPCLVAAAMCIAGSGAVLRMATGPSLSSGTALHVPTSAGHAVGDKISVANGGDAYSSSGLYVGINSGAQFVVFAHAVVNSGG